jgi:hypothetical protein
MSTHQAAERQRDDGGLAFGRLPVDHAADVLIAAHGPPVPAIAGPAARNVTEAAIAAIRPNLKGLAIFN